MRRGAGTAGGRGEEGRPAAGPRWIGPVFLAAAALLSLLFYRDFVLHPDRLLFGTDMVIEGFPLRRFAVEEVRAGRGLPLWNPFVYGGLPFLATLPGPVFYPTSLLYLALPLHRAIGWTFVLHTFLAAAFGYFAARSFRLGRAAAAVTGTAFALSGYLASTLYGGHDGRMFAIVLVPLAFGLAERGLRTGAGVWFLGLAAAVALQIFTPHTQVMYFSSLWLVAYGVVRLAVLARDAEEGPAAVGGRAAWLAGAFVLAALVGAVQLLPTWALLGHVSRAAQETGYAFAASWGLPAQEVTALVLPDLVGSLESYWGTNPFKLHTEYMGAVAVALAGVAVAGSLRGGGPRRDRRTVWFLTAATVLGVLFAVGSATPVHRLAYEAVPLIGSFRAPSMMLGPVAFFVALLAGFGWERVRDARSGFPWTAAWLAAAPFLALGLAAALAPRGLLDFALHSWYPAGWPRRPPEALAGPLRTGGVFVLAAWLGVLGAAWARGRGRAGEWLVLPLLALMVFDLWRVDARYLRTAPLEDVFAADPAIRTMVERGRPGERAWPLERTYEANELMYFGVPTVAGTQKFLLDGYARLVGGLGYDNLLSRPALWGLFDLRWVSVRSVQEIPLLRPVEIAGAGGPRLYEVMADLPHAFFPAAVEATAEAAEALRLTLALDDPTAAAVVEAPAGSPPVAAGRGTATVERWHPDEVTLRVEAEEEGLLFVSEVWAPGWRGSVDGAEVTVHRVNAAFRGLMVPAGRHEVRLVYAPPSVRWGAWLSAAGLVGLLVGLGVPALRRARREERGSAPGARRPPAATAAR